MTMGQRYDEFAGVDISPRQIDLARRTGITATVASAADLPFADQSVDAVATIMTTTDFDSLPSVFAEARRVLRPGGRLVVVAAHPLPSRPNGHSMTSSLVVAAMIARCR
jgi:ubiquinone/menaquinone biosynthesis C-methylase UbiE